MSEEPADAKVEVISEAVGAKMFAEVMMQIQKDYFLVPKNSQNRFRVETTGEQSEGFKDVGFPFSNAETAEKFAIDFIPVNISWRILFETMQVVKVKEYTAPYLG